MTAPLRVLIAGAGWRVTRFVVPALINEGVSRDGIAIVRRSGSSHSPPELRGIQIVTDLKDLDMPEFQLSINCVARESLVTIQRALVARAPGALHFCDTPIFNDRRDLVRVLSLSRHRLFSLEDWPLMPNLVFLGREMAKAEGAAELRVEQFGIAGHFLSLYRSLCGVRPASRRLIQKGDALTGHPTTRKTVTFQSPKNFAVAKASTRSDNSLVEDFHEVESAPHDDPEVLYRVVDDVGVRYYCGAQEISTHRVLPELIAGFAPLNDRKNVHELDKFIGLTTLFRSALRKDTTSAYPYLHSVRDALTVRRLDAHQMSLLF